MKRALLALWIGCSLSACSADHPSRTELAITVISDLKVPDELDYLTLDVTGLEKTQHSTADLTEQDLPRYLTLVHDSGPLGPIVVIVTGSRDGQRIIESKVQASFQLRTSVDVTIELQSACKQVFCDADQTCRDGECRSIPKIDPRKPDAGPQIELDGGVAGNGGSGGGPGSMVKPGDDAMVPMNKPDADVPADTGPPPNQAPICEITGPDDNQNFNPGQPVELTGTCTDPETGMLSGDDLHWTQGIGGDAQSIGTGSAVTIADLAVGTETFTLCAHDPDDSTLGSACDEITVIVSEPGPPTAVIDQILQDGQTAPYESDAEITLEGIGTGVNITYSWTDSFSGKEFATKATARIAAPEIGRHRVTFTVTDENDDSASDAKTFDVLPAGESTLVQPFDGVNETLDEGADAIAVDSESQVLAARGAVLYRFDATVLDDDVHAGITGTPAPAITAINQIFIGADKVYLATSTGLVVCDYAAGAAIDGTTCDTFNGGGFPSDNVTAVLRGTVDNVDILVLGTTNGLFVPDNPNGSTTGITLTGAATAGRDIRAIVQGVGVDARTSDVHEEDVFWFTSPGQLGIYWPSDDRISGRGDGKMLMQNSIAKTADDKIWVGSSNKGVARWTETQVGMWNYWNLTDGTPKLSTNSVFAVATTRVTLAGDAHDILWFGSNEGLNRFDVGTDPRSLETFRTQDGLPGSSVIAIALTPDGDKVISTDAGLAIYVGP